MHSDSGADAAGVVTLHWQALDTLVLLMGGSRLAQIADELQRHGRAADTPVAVVREATGAEQRVWRGSLGDIVRQTAGEALSPCIIMVGSVCELPVCL